jgi:cytochrome c2
MKIRLFFGAAALAVATATSPAIAQDGDPDAGKKVFRQCQACHMVGDNAKPRVGPPLNDIFGRQAGTYEGFRYSPAMKGAGENGLVWNVETVSAYLEDPRGYIKGNRMAYPGLRKEEDVTNVIAYLKQYDDEPDNDDAESSYEPK